MRHKPATQGKQRTVQRSLRIPIAVDRAVARSAGDSGRDYSAVANELLEEALRVRRCPGMVFADGPGGRRPRIAGTGIDIWEVIAAYHSVGNSLARLRRSYHWLSEVQLRTALGYYKLYREETERWIKRNESLTLEALAESHPTLLTDLE